MTVLTVLLLVATLTKTRISNVPHFFLNNPKRFNVKISPEETQLAERDYVASVVVAVVVVAVVVAVVLLPSKNFPDAL